MEEGKIGVVAVGLESARRRVAEGDAKSFLVHSRRKIEAGRQCVAHQRSIRIPCLFYPCCAPERRKSHAEPCCWTLVEPWFPSKRDFDKNNRSNECFCFYLSNGWLITCFPTVSFLIFTRVRHEFGADFVWRTKMFRMIFERWWRKRDEERFVKRDLKGKSGEKIVSCLFWIWFDTGYMMIRVQISFVLRVN